MLKNQLSSPNEALRDAVLQAFPQHSGIANITLGVDFREAWRILTELLAVDESRLAAALAEVLGVACLDQLGPVESEAINMVPFSFCQTNCLLPLRIENRKLLVATANPFDSNVAESLGFITGKPIQWGVAPPFLIDKAVLEIFTREAEKSAASATDKAEKKPDEAVENEIVALGNRLLTEAIQARASDLHIQPYLGSGMVRIRVDGEMRTLSRLPDAVTASVVRYLKARGGMESTNNVIPQDGRTSLVFNDRNFDLRISSLPVRRGERLVIRFLDQSRVHRLNKIGFSLAALQAMRRIIARPSGLVLMTGPTGSGKTSTLYSMIAELNKSNVNIITVENPVEYQIPGISQVEVNEKSGRSFAAALRSILRQDPDVVLIGEIRDRETADIAMQAALTGHLVLSTLHTNDAITTIPRLLGLGLIPSIVGDALAAVVSQRLCRRLCPACKTPVTEPLTNEEKVFLDVTRHLPACRAVGCSECDNTGYHGRLPIVDIVENSIRLRELISAGETRISVLESAREGGLKSLSVSGGLRIISGDTTVSEVFSVVGLQFWGELAEYYGTELTEEVFGLSSRALNAEPGVILISRDSALQQLVTQPLETDGYRLFTVSDADAANNVLHEEEGIVFVIKDVDEALSLEQALSDIKETGRCLYWSRLPALVLFSEELAQHEEQFRKNGMISPCITKPCAPETLLLQIRRSQAR